MTHLWPAGQPITVTADAEGQPTAFVWQEQRHTVARIVQRWEVDGEWWHVEGRIWRDYVALITHDHLFCVLYHDRLAAEWRLVRLYD